jgi:hypothetical protein
MSDPDAVFGMSPSNLSHGLGHHPGSAAEYLNLDQMMTLVDSILPFEACLYYQVIPLSIEAAHLHLGMVNPDDSAAMDYVRRQVAYINYSVNVWTVESDWHREMLSKYLSYRSKSQSQAAQSNTSKQGPGIQSPFPVPPPEQTTYVVDSPTFLPNEAADSRAATEPAAAKSGTVREVQNQLNRHRQSRQSAPAQDCNPPLSLDLPTSNLPLNLSAMGKLPPKQMMQALLIRVLQDGIGRLYFERHEKTGRILWSKDGVVQAALEHLSLPLFQSVINEFKRLNHLPLLPTTTTKQVEIERTYRQERVVLRFRLMIGTHGEEATLQVLRGAALKFYQQQQIDKLGRDALTFAHRLQDQIEQIRERSRQTFTLEGMPATTLTTISQLLKSIEADIDQLIQANHQDKGV